MSTPRETAQEILRYLFTNANGDSADAIKKYQGNELPGFGIMYPQLKELATKYEPSNDVALELITKNTREARMMAMVLSIPETLSDSQITQFINSAVTEELKNLLARHIISKLIIKKENIEIIRKLPVDIKLKALVQNYRSQSQLPEYNTCINLIENWAKLQTKNLNDGMHFTEAIYKHYSNQQSTLIEILKTIADNHKDLSNEITQWIEDFKYLT